MVPIHHLRLMAPNCDIPHQIGEKVFNVIYVEVPFNLVEAFLKS